MSNIQRSMSNEQVGFRFRKTFCVIAMSIGKVCGEGRRSNLKPDTDARLLQPEKMFVSLSICFILSLLSLLYGLRNDAEG